MPENKAKVLCIMTATIDDRISARYQMKHKVVPCKITWLVIWPWTMAIISNQYQYLIIFSFFRLFSVFLPTLPLPSSASSLSMIFLSSSLTTFLSVTLASLSVLLCSLHPCLSFLVLAGASIWSEGGNNRWWFHSRRAERDHHEPPYPPGLDVPLVLSAQVQLPSSGKDLPQGCA